jgi:hypothetical protein
MGEGAEEALVVLASHCQVSDLLPIGCLIIVKIVSSANLMTVLETCMTTQTWVNR